MKDLYVKALKLWGDGPQLGMLQEECGELIAAVNRFERQRNDSLRGLAEELADVEIVLGQVKHMIFSRGDCRKLYMREKRQKVKRFRDKLEADNLNAQCKEDL